MKSHRHGGFVSVFVDVPMRGQSWQRYREVEHQLRELTNWRQPGGTVEILLDNNLHYDPNRLPSWRFELVWYDSDIANSLMFKLAFNGIDSLA